MVRVGHPRSSTARLLRPPSLTPSLRRQRVGVCASSSCRPSPSYRDAPLRWCLGVRFARPGCALNRLTWSPVNGSSARVSTIRSATVVRQRFFGISQPTPKSSQRNTSGRAGCIPRDRHRTVLSRPPAAVCVVAVSVVGGVLSISAITGSY